MQYDVTTPSEYMAALEDDWRKETLTDLRQLVHELAPELKELIRYRMLSYEDGDGGVFGLNLQKHYVSFYAGDADKIDSDGSLLAGLNRGKGCIRFSKTKSVDGSRIREFIARAVELHRAGADVDC